MKDCNICKLPKDLSAFRVVNKTNKPHSYCKECENKRDRDRYLSRRSQMLERKKQTYNPVARKEYNDKYHELNRDILISNSRNYYYNNQEKLKAQKRQYNIDNRIEILRKKVIYQKRK